MSYQPSKYFDQRYRYFMNYGLGIKLDEESWFSVTPEVISEHQARRCLVLFPVCQNGRCLVLDAFCGIGGNSISFARSGYLVVACDLDRTKVRKARENSQIYGVEERIIFICCDIFQHLKNFRIDVIFLSPPWGGPQYLKSLFCLESMLVSGVNGIELLLQALEVSENVIYFLPKNTNIVPLYSILKCNWEVELNYLNRKLKSLTLYFGLLASK